MATFDDLYQLTADEIAARLPQEPDYLVGGYGRDENPEKRGLRLLLHYTLMPPEEKWQETDKTYRPGASYQIRFTREKMDEFKQNGQVVLFDPPVPMQRGERLMQDPWGGLWLGQAQQPFDDPHLRPVGPLPNRTPA